MGADHRLTDLSIIKDADLVIEAATEDMKPKIAQNWMTLRPEVIIAANTSSLSITEIAAAASGPTRSSACISSTPFP